MEKSTPVRSWLMSDTTPLPCPPDLIQQIEDAIRLYSSSHPQLCRIRDAVVEALNEWNQRHAAVSGEPTYDPDDYRGG